MTNNEILDALKTFRDTPKFRCTEPQFRILSPSPASVTQPLEKALNDCASELSSNIKRGAPPELLKSCIAASLKSVQKPFDTEDREYLAYYYNQLGQCVNIEVGSMINRWLYGFLLSTLLRLFNRA